jgi:hypothetical protein
MTILLKEVNWCKWSQGSALQGELVLLEQFLQATSLPFFTPAENESGRAIFLSPLLRRDDQSSSLGLVRCYVFGLTTDAGTFQSERLASREQTSVLTHDKCASSHKPPSKINAPLPSNLGFHFFAFKRHISPFFLGHKGTVSSHSLHTHEVLSYQCTRPSATSVQDLATTSACGYKLIVYMRSYATSVYSLKLLVYAVLSYWCMRPEATSVCGLKLLVYVA